MGIVHGTLVMCKTVQNFICCKNIFSHPVSIIQSNNQNQQAIYEYQGLLQEDTTIEIKDSNEVILKQQENENQIQIDPDCQIDRKYIIDAPHMEKEILTQINASYEGWQQIFKEKKKPHQLTIYTKSYTTQDNNKVNILRSTFIVPSIPAQTWLKFYNDIEVQRTLDTKLDRYVIVENYKNFFINYASYKKMLMIDSRDMIYFKTIKKIENNLIDVCKSIELEQFPVVEGKTRAQIFLSGYIATEYTDPQTQKAGVQVSMYSDIDMKMNVPTLISRPAAIKELRGYIEKAIEKLETIKDKYLSVPDYI